MPAEIGLATCVQPPYPELPQAECRDLVIVGANGDLTGRMYPAPFHRAGEGCLSPDLQIVDLGRD